MSLQLCPTLSSPMDCSPSRLLRPWNSPGENTGVGCHSLLQRIFPTQGLTQQTLDPAQSSHWWTDPFFLCRHILKGLAREHPHTHHLDSPRSMLFSLLYHIRITLQQSLNWAPVRPLSSNETQGCLLSPRASSSSGKGGEGRGPENHTMDGHFQDYPSMR